MKKSGHDLPKSRVPHRSMLPAFFPAAELSLACTGQARSEWKIAVITFLGLLWLVTDPFKAAAATPAPLPFWLHYCDDPTCGGKQPLVIHICPESDLSCTPSRQTTVVPQVDGQQIDQILFPLQIPPGYITQHISGSGSVMGNLVFSSTSPVVVKSDVDITLSYYGVTPAWGEVTSLNFVSWTMTSPELVTTVFRYPTFLVHDEPAQLHERGRDIIAHESQMAGLRPGPMHASFLPSEFSTLGEGNFSDGNHNITINYGNPAYIAAVGSVYMTALPRFAHEYVHELFSDISTNYPGNNSCLNEGLADAFAFAAGFLPESDFGPIGLRRTDFNQGCAGIVANFESHDAGNCPFWQVQRLGLLMQGFVGQMLHPKHRIEFDSCDLTSARTGNALVVLFSDAAGRDMTPAIQLAGIPNAGSLEGARRALGLVSITPQVNLVKAVKPSFSNLTINYNYQLQVSSDFHNWTNEGAPFTATNSSMVYPAYWDVENWAKLFFRLQFAP